MTRVASGPWPARGDDVAGAAKADKKSKRRSREDKTRRRGTEGRPEKRDEEEDASDLKLGEDFAEAQCLLNSEVAILLESSTQSEQEEETESNPTFVKTFQYVSRFSRFKNKAAVKEVRTLLTKKSLEEFELACLANLCPQSAEEAKALIPSLSKKFSDEELETILTDLRTYSNF